MSHDNFPWGVLMLVGAIASIPYWVIAAARIDAWLWKTFGHKLRNR